MRPRLTVALAAVSALLLLPAPSRGQGTCTAQGFVFDAEGNPLPEVKVLLEYKGHNPQRYRTKTDSKGKFIHVAVYEGLYDLTFSKEGAGEVTVKDFRIREIQDLEKAPTFRLGGVKKTVAPTAEAVEAPAAGAAPVAAGPDAAVLAAELQKAADALTAGRLDEAVASYEAVLAQAPGLASVHHNLGLVHKKKGDLAKAEASFRKAAELQPELAEPHGALSVLLAAQGKSEAAVAEAQEAVKDAPQNAQYQYNLGVLMKDTGRSAEAKDAFLKAEALDPANAEIQFHLGTVFMNLGELPEATARLEKYVAAAPADASNLGAAKAILVALQKKK